MQGDLAGLAVAGLVAGEIDDRGAFAAGVFQCFLESVEGTVVDDRGVVVVIDVRAVFCRVFTGFFNQFIFLAFMDEDIIHVGADLAGVELLDEHDPAHCFVQWIVRIYDSRTLAAQFQYHRCQVFGRRGHHRAPGLA